MRCSALAITLLILTSSPTLAKMEIEKVEACYGRFGPVRKTLDYYPHDEVVFRFKVKGVKADEGALDVNCVWKLLDEKGNEVQSEKLPFKGTMAFGTDFLPYNLGLFLPVTATPGNYLLKVTVKDNLSSEETGFEKKLNLKAMEYAIVSPAFFYDANFSVPAPAGGVVGQRLHYRLGVIGFDRSSGKIENEMMVEVLDKDGKLLQHKPLYFAAEKSDEKSVKELLVLDLNGWMGLSKAGEFILRITVTDRNSKKKATWEAPLKVTDP
jgi:hypothetical protein